MPYFIRNVSFLSLTDRSPPTRPVLSLYVFTLLLRNMCSHDSVPFPCFRHRHRQRIIAEYCSSSHGIVLLDRMLLGVLFPCFRHRPCRCAHGSVPMIGCCLVCPWWCAHGSAPMIVCCLIGCCSVLPCRCSHGGVVLDRMLLDVPMQVCPWKCSHDSVLLDRILLGVPFLCFQTSPMQVCP